jgi:hypothetical protein
MKTNIVSREYERRLWDLYKEAAVATEAFSMKQCFEYSVNMLDGYIKMLSDLDAMKGDRDSDLFV